MLQFTDRSGEAKTLNSSQISMNMVTCVSPVVNVSPCMCMLKYTNVLNKAQVWKKINSSHTYSAVGGLCINVKHKDKKSPL